MHKYNSYILKMKQIQNSHDVLSHVSSVKMEIATQEKRSTVFREKFQTLMSTYNFGYDQDALSLMKFTCQWLDESTSSGDVVLSAVLPGFEKFFQGLVGISPQVREAFQKLQQEICILQTTISQQDTIIVQQKDQIDELKNRVEILEEKEKLVTTKLNSYDLARLFNYYYVEPILPKHYGCSLWRDFCNILDQKEKELDENKITIQELKQWLQPLENDIDVDVLTLREMMRDRHIVAHSDLRSVIKQQKFIDDILNYQIPSGYEYEKMFTFIVAKFSEFKGFKRMQ